MNCTTIFSSPTALWCSDLTLERPSRALIPQPYSAAPQLPGFAATGHCYIYILVLSKLYCTTCSARPITPTPRRINFLSITSHLRAGNNCCCYACIAASLSKITPWCTWPYLPTITPWCTWPYLSTILKLSYSYLQINFLNINSVCLLSLMSDDQAYSISVAVN